MRTARIHELETHRLADGGIARVTRFGRKYGYSRSFPDGSCPETVTGVTKAEAYRYLEEALRRDVLELD